MGWVSLGRAGFTAPRGRRSGPRQFREVGGYWRTWDWRGPHLACLQTIYLPRFSLCRNPLGPRTGGGSVYPMR